MARYYTDENGNLTKSDSETNKKKKNGKRYTTDENGNLIVLPEEDVETSNKKADEEDIAPVKKTTESKTSNKKIDTVGKVNERTWFQAGAFEDGLDLIDIPNTIFGTINDVAAGVAEGVVRAGEGILDAGAYGVAWGADLVGADSFADDVRKVAQKDETGALFEQVRANLPNIENSLLGEKSRGVTNVFGQMAATLATANVGGAIGLGAKGISRLAAAFNGVSAGGLATSEAYAGDATDIEAAIYGALTGLTAYGASYIGGGYGDSVKATGLSHGVKNLDGKVATGLAKTITSRIKDEAAKRVVGNAVETGVKASFEGFEEVAEGLASIAYKKLTYMSEEDIMKIYEDEDLLEQFLVGTFASGAMQTPSYVRSLKTKTDYVTGRTTNEQTVIDKEIEKRISLEEAENGKLSNKQKQKIEERVESDMEKGFISTDTIEEALGGDTYTAYKSTLDSEESLKQEKEAIEKEFNTLNKMKNGDMTGEQTDRREALRVQLEEITAKIEDTAKNSQREQLKTKLSEEVSEKVKGDRLYESYNERARRKEAFQADLDGYTEAQRKVIESAINSGILNNTNRTHEFVDLIAKIAADKGVSFDFTNNKKLRESGFAIGEGVTVNGFTSKNGVTLNMDSAKTWQATVGHEITHVLEGTEAYTELQKALFDYAKTKGEYDSRLASVTELYQKYDPTADPSKELTADLVGDYLFNDVDFINNLSVNHRNIFQKIYDEIKYLAKVVTAGSKEARQIEKMKRAFEKAYQAQKNTTADSGTKYALERVGDTDYVRSEKNLFVKDDGTLATEKEVFDSLEGRTLHLTDGDVKIVKNLPGKRMYKELFNRYPKNKKNISDMKQLNSDVNYNMEELLTNSKIIDENAPDVNNRHQEQGITGFDTRRVKFYDGSKAYDIEFSIGILENRDRVAYAKKFYGYDAELTKKIQDAETRGSTNTPMNQLPVSEGNALNEGVQFSNISDSYADSISQNSEKSSTASKNLSLEQEEYFKDSVVRDEDGNLKVMYHGTSAGGHTVFDPYGKARYGLFGAGSYFTDSKEIAESYTKKGKGTNPQVYETYLNIKNPIDMDAQADPAAWAAAMPDVYFPESGTNEDFYRAMEEYFEDAEYPRWEAAETAMGVIEEMGYDGITHIGGGRVNADGERHRVYIAFQPEQIKNVDNVKPTSDADIRFSLSEDNAGHKLSEDQEAFFQESKIRDENGDLMVMYHGTPNGEFTVFRDGTYFTPNKAYADKYQNPSASSLNSRKSVTTPKTYEVYLNIKKPFDLSDPEARAIYINEYIKGGNAIGINPYLSDAEYAKIKSIDWTEGEDLREFLVDNGYDYDGLVLDEGATGGYGDAVDYRGASYVIFSPEQVKSIDNLNPTSDQDIRNSLSNAGATPARRGTALRDLRLEEDIAPVAENQKANVADTKVGNVKEADYAPYTEAEANTLRDENFARLSDADAPPETETPYYNDETEAPLPDDPFKDRDMKEVGNRSVKAYMYENPEVKPFFQEEANIMLGELERTIKGERVVDAQVMYDTNGEAGIYGTTRHTSDDIAYLRDELNISYADIRKGLENIIKDDGLENNAVSKRIEFLLNDRLLNGYRDMDYGFEYPPNEGYINLLNEKQITEYNEESRARFFENMDAYVPPVEENIAPVREDAAPKARVKEAPIREEYEAITPKPKYGNRLTRVDNIPPEHKKIAEILDSEPTPQTRKSRIWARIKANVFDKGAVFEDLSLKKKNRELIAKWNYMLYSEARAQRLMGQGENGVKALNNIMEEVNKTGKTKQFYEYMYHALNVDRMTLEERYDEVPNKPVFGDSVDANASRAAMRKYEAENPEFKQFAQEVYDYNSYTRKLLVDGGVISQETADLWEEMYPHFVPIRRADSDGLGVNVPLDTGKTGVNAPIKRATGGSSDILPLFDTMAQRTIQTYKAIAKNRFGVELKNTLGATVSKEVAGVDEMIDSIAAQDGLLQEGKDGRNPTFTVFENGEKITYEITEDMYDALKPVSGGLAYTNKILNTASNFHRGLLTEYNPVFMLTNAIKDVQDMLINSQHPIRTYAKIPEAYYQLISKGYWYNEYMANGGEQNTYFDNDTGTFKTENKGIAKLLDIPPLSTISKLNNLIEMSPRLAEYIASREAGRSVEVSMLDAARVTTNFSAGGDITKFLNRNGATFLNASVQGAMQNVRNVREAAANGWKGWVGLTAKFALAGLPALILNNLVWEDDEEYEELSDYVKQSYYIVAKTDDGKFIRIPKGRTIAVIQNAFEQISNAATGDDEVDLKAFLELTATNLAPNNPIENNILAPVIQVANNKTWYGEDLVPQRLADLPAAEQFDESTDAFSKWLGEKINVSPVKINYLIDQYSGGVGDTIMPMLTPEAESGDNSIVGNLLAPLKSKFTTDSVMNNQNVADFYDMKDDLTINANASAATDDDILKSKYMNSVNAELGKLYAEKREIQNSNLSDETKYGAVRVIQQKIVNLTKEALSSYDDIAFEDDYREGGAYARVGGNEDGTGGKLYKLNDDGEWQKLSDEQVTKYEVTKAAGNDSYATDGTNHYRWYVPGEDADEDTEPGWRTISKKELARQNEITKALKISPNEYWSKKAEYSYAYEHPENYAIARAVGGYDAYKSYSSDLFDIKADKDSEGNSISGSRKNKVIDYINGLDADYYEKIILYKSEYTSDDTYNSEIIEYLNSREDISYSDMVTILKKLGFTVTDDGNVYW